MEHNEIRQIITFAREFLSTTTQLCEFDKIEEITIASASGYMATHEIAECVNRCKISREARIKAMRSILREMSESVRAYEIKDIAPVPAKYERIPEYMAHSWHNTDLDMDRGIAPYTVMAIAGTHKSLLRGSLVEPCISSSDNKAA